MPLSSQEDHARQSEIHKNRNGAYINMHSLSPRDRNAEHQALPSTVSFSNKYTS